MKRRRYKSILIVEDDFSIRETLKAVIEEEGYLVFMASNGIEALKKLEVLGEGNLPCLILTDLLMPKMDGYRFIHELEKSQLVLSIPVIVMSAHGQGMPGHKFIRKPFNIDGLLDTIRELASVNPECGELRRDSA